MRELWAAYPRLRVAALVGLLAFAACYHAAFMRGVRPQPIRRDDLSARAEQFAALEGWTGPNRYALTVPIEGSAASVVHASGGGNVDRETLHDPAWETTIFASLNSLSRIASLGNPPDPILLVDMTPDGEVTRYAEATSPLSPASIDKVTKTRTYPLRDLETAALFDTPPEDRVAGTDEERTRAVEVARAFFARHEIVCDGDPTSVVVRRQPNKEAQHVVALDWQRPGVAGTLDLTRVLVWSGRVAAYERALRPAVPPPPPSAYADLTTKILPQVAFLTFFVCSILVAVLAALKKRQGEINVRATIAIFAFYGPLSFLGWAMTLGVMNAVMMSFVGHSTLWFQLIPTYLVFPIISLASSLMVSAAWAVGESEAYVVWPQHLIRPMSAFMRGRWRSREIAAPIVGGYMCAFVALGVAAVAGLFAPQSDAGSVLPLGALSAWPVFPYPAVAALMSSLMVTLACGMFLMTYARRVTRRPWAAVLVAGTATSLFSALQPSFPVAYWTGLLMAVAFAFATMVVFVRIGPLASLAMVFAFYAFFGAYPLMLLGDAHYAATGALAILVALVPAAVALLAAAHPRESAGDGQVPAHVRRVLDRLRIGEEFEVARRVQAGLLPSSPPASPGLDVAGTCVPANEVGGDYYDYFALDGGRLAVAVGDVSGKGVGAAIYMTLTKSYMTTQSHRASDPVHMLSRVNGHLKRNLARGTFVTMAYAVIDAGAGSLTYTRAGHNPPLLVRANGEGDFLSAPGLALGSTASSVFESITRAETLDLRPGDLLLLYTDGVTEAMNARGDEYGEERLVERTKRAASGGATAAATVEAILKDVRSFAGRAPQHDDITIVAVRVGAGA